MSDDIPAQGLLDFVETDLQRQRDSYYKNCMEMYGKLPSAAERVERFVHDEATQQWSKPGTIERYLGYATVPDPAEGGDTIIERVEFHHLLDHNGKRIGGRFVRDDAEGCWRALRKDGTLGKLRGECVSDKEMTGFGWQAVIGGAVCTTAFGMARAGRLTSTAGTYVATSGPTTTTIAITGGSGTTAGGLYDPPPALPLLVPPAAPEPAPNVMAADDYARIAQRMQEIRDAEGRQAPA
jgi:hypothetical protein